MTIAIPQSARVRAVPNSTFATGCVVVSLVWVLVLRSHASLAIGALLPAAAAARADAATGRVPDRLLVLAGGAVLIGIVTAGDGRSTAVAAASSALLMTAPLLALHILWPSVMGFGDVKLATVLGATIGTVHAVDPVALTLAALAIASAVTLVVAVVGRRSALPFAPGLVFGTTAVLALTPILGLEILR